MRKIKDLPGKIGPVFVHSLIFKGILGAKLYKKIFAGIAHGFVFWGMLVLFVGHEFGGAQRVGRRAGVYGRPSISGSCPSAWIWPGCWP